MGLTSFLMFLKPKTTNFLAIFCLILAVLISYFWLKTKELKAENENLKQKISILEVENEKIRANLVENQNKCQEIFHKNNTLLKQIRALQVKPKPVKPQIVEVNNCKIEIETKESLKDEDPILNTISNIGF